MVVLRTSQCALIPQLVGSALLTANPFLARKGFWGDDRVLLELNQCAITTITIVLQTLGEMLSHLCQIHAVTCRVGAYVTVVVQRHLHRAGCFRHEMSHMCDGEAVLMVNHQMHVSPLLGKLCRDIGDSAAPLAYQSIQVDVHPKEISIGLTDLLFQFILELTASPLAYLNKQ